MTLPVFGFRAEAEAFMFLEGLGGSGVPGIVRPEVDLAALRVLRPRRRRRGGSSAEGLHANAGGTRGT